MDLAERVLAARRCGDVLVLCRHAAARRMALRSLLGARRAWPHVEVTTVAGALAARAPRRLLPGGPAESDLTLPADHPWAERLVDRPKLRALLFEHVERAHRQRALSGSLEGLPAPVWRLVDAGWGAPNDLPAWVALASHPREQVVAVGFVGSGGPAGDMGTAERLLLERLGVIGEPVEPHHGLIPACEVADVAAEARAAVAWLSRKSGRSLVLVQSTATADRFACAARRNDLPVADDDADALAEHSLVALLRGLVPLFASRGRAPLTLTELHHLMTHPVLSRKAADKGAREEADAVAAADGGGDGMSLRHARALLGETRRTTASAAEWTACVADVATRWMATSDSNEQPRSPRARVAATVLQSRVRAISRHAARGTLGAMADLVADLGLSRYDDHLGAAVRSALRRAESVEASEMALTRAVEGAVDVGALHDGVTIMRYDAYDGRAADALVLLDVHHKGVGAAPALDPLLGEEGLRALGLATPHEVVEGRLTAARWATARATESLAIVTTHDATGRAVVAPAQMRLEVTRDAVPGVGAVGSHGTRLTLPEATDRERVRGLGGDEPSPRLALQLDAEWARSGWRFGDQAALQPRRGLSLDALLADDDPRPEDLRPWLGEAGAALGGEDGLPPGFVLSATRLGAFTACMYRGWVGSVLGLRAPETLEEDLGAREIGTAAHSVLEAVGRDGSERQLLRRVVPDDQVRAARLALAETCARRTPACVEETREVQGARTETPAAHAARQALVERWKRHWTRYAEGAVTGAAQVRLERCKYVADKELDKALSEAAIVDLAAGAVGKGTIGEGAKALRRVVAQERSLDGLRSRWGDVLDEVGKKDVAKLEHALEKPSESLLALIAQARLLLSDLPTLDGDGDTVAAEAGIGGEDGAPLPLGRASVPVRGQIDAVLRWQTEGAPCLEICDYKTGSASSAGQARDVLRTLSRPQLPFYALAVRHGLVEGLPADAVSLPVGALSYAKVKSSATTRIPLAPEDLDAVAVHLGALMDRARDGDFPLRPLDDQCPALGRRAWCDFVESCRLRALPVPPSVETDMDPDSGEGDDA